MKIAQLMTLANIDKPLVLYSINTWLAYRVAQIYYREEHYVWCAPYFSSDAVPAWDYTNPPSSSPSEIYNSLLEDVRRGDLHSLKIEVNKAGILRGAHIKEKQNIITKKQKAEIFAAVSKAETRDFKPLIYVIPYHNVVRLAKKAPLSERAHPLSLEFLIERLPRRLFDIIQLDRS